jgi:hypothetical protein
VLAEKVLLLGPVLDFLGFLYRAFLKKILKTFFKTPQLPTNYGEVWAPVLKNSRSYSVLNFFLKGIFGNLGGFWSGAALTSPNLVGTTGR